MILILSILSGRASVNNILEQMPLNRSEQLPAPYNVAKCNLGKVNLEECWSAVSPAILGVARFL